MGRVRKRGANTARLQGALKWSRSHSSIDVADPDQVTYWCAHFECTGSALREAVAAVGPSPKAVLFHLVRVGATPVRVFCER
jgi:uncharacterized protein DUF3606